MPDYGARIIIEGDAKQVVAEFEKLKRSLNAIPKEGKKASLSLSEGWRAATLQFAAVTAAVYTAKKGFDATVTAVVNYNKAILDSSKAVGIATSEFSRIVQVSDDFGISMGEVEAALAMATKRGFAPSIESLAALADRVNAISDPTRRAAELAKIFGRNWTSLDPVLQSGGDSLRKMAGEVASGLIVTKAAVAQTEEYRLRVDKLNDSLTALKYQVGLVIVNVILEEVHANQRAVEATDSRIEAQKRLIASGREVNVATVSAMAAQIRHNASLDAAERITQANATAAARLRNELEALPDVKMIGIRVSAVVDEQSQEIMRLMAGGQASVNRNYAEQNKEAWAAENAHRMEMQAATEKTTDLSGRVVQDMKNAAIDAAGVAVAAGDQGAWSAAEGVAKSFGGEIDDIYKKILRAIAAMNTLTGGGGGGGGGGGDDNIPRQHGGPVWPGQSYVVGEKGPETFVPRDAGTIVNNADSRTLNMGGVTVNNTGDLAEFESMLRRSLRGVR